MSRIHSHPSHRNPPESAKAPDSGNADAERVYEDMLLDRYERGLPLSRDDERQARAIMRTRAWLRELEID